MSSNKFKFFSLGIDYFKKMMEFLKNKIIIICSKNLFYNITKICKECSLINEDEMYKNLTIMNIQQLLPYHKYKPSWYFQQFLKMAYYNISKNNYYLIWDSDTLLLNNITFFNPINNKPYFTMKNEYHKPYFDTLKIILGLDKKSQKSFISEHMMINKNIMKEIINKIESNKFLKGNTFFEKIINSINQNKSEESPFRFSEFESYGTYIYQYYRNKYEYRSLRSCRKGFSYIGLNLKKEILNWVSRSFDTISFEKWTGENTAIINLIMNETIRENYEFKNVINNSRLLNNF